MKGGLGLALGVALSLGAGAAPAAAEGSDPSRSIVKLYVTAVMRDVTSPWRGGWGYPVTGSGAVIAGGRILTAAHVVNDQTFVVVRRNGTARVEHWRYVHSEESLLAVQMDAAIDPGSSGGPLVRDGRLVGVAMQGFKDSAIGCAVPVPVVRHFLDDVADGRLDGIPELGLEWQGLESATLKASLQVPPAGTGVLLTRVATSPAGGVLWEGDVLLSLGGRDVADDGTVELRAGERTEVVRAVDGREVRDLASLVRLVERPGAGPLVVFSLEDGSRVTVDRAQAVATAAEVLARYEVPADRSARLAAQAGTKQVAAPEPGAGAQ
jgi:S1-C subfamily serine protease